MLALEFGPAGVSEPDQTPMIVITKISKKRISKYGFGKCWSNLERIVIRVWAVRNLNKKIVLSTNCSMPYGKNCELCVKIQVCNSAGALFY